MINLWWHLDHSPVTKNPEGRLDHSLEPLFTELSEQIKDSDYMSRPGHYGRGGLVERAFAQATETAKYHQHFPKGRIAIQRRVFETALEEAIQREMEPYFRMIWNTTTKVERFVLYQLSHDHWINPQNSVFINHLMRRRIIVLRDGHYAIFSNAFAWFVRRIQDPAEVEEWIAAQKASLWHSIRVGVAALFFGLLLFVASARRDLFESYLSYFLAVGAAAVTLIQIFSEFFSHFRRKVSAG